MQDAGPPLKPCFVPHRLRLMLHRLPCHYAPAADAFRHCPLFIGGPVNKNLLHVVHGRRDVEGALEIIEVRAGLRLV